MPVAQAFGVAAVAQEALPVVLDVGDPPSTDAVRGSLGELLQLLVAISGS